VTASATIFVTRADDTAVGTVYVLRFEDGDVYVGWTQCYDDRLKAHLRGNGSVFTRQKWQMEARCVVEAHFSGTRRAEEFARKAYAHIAAQSH
jgi:predicted GIY-YIG superfamily endonuclease